MAGFIVPYSYACLFLFLPAFIGFHSYLFILVSCPEYQSLVKDGIKVQSMDQYCQVATIT